MIIKIEHPMPSSAEMRARTIARANAGLPLGAMHVHSVVTTRVTGRKLRGDKLCNGKDVTCMPGKDGKCVACDNHD